MLVILHSYLLSHKNGTLWHVINIRVIYLLPLAIVSSSFFLSPSSLPSSVPFSSLLPPSLLCSFFSLFLAFAFIHAILKVLPSFPSAVFLASEWSWGSHASFSVNAKCRVWKKYNLTSLQNADVPHCPCLGTTHSPLNVAPGMTSPRVCLLSLASDIAVSF